MATWSFNLIRLKSKKIYFSCSKCEKLCEKLKMCINVMEGRLRWSRILFSIKLRLLFPLVAEIRKTSLDFYRCFYFQDFRCTIHLSVGFEHCQKVKRWSHKCTFYLPFRIEVPDPYPHLNGGQNRRTSALSIPTVT